MHARVSITLYSLPNLDSLLNLEIIDEDITLSKVWIDGFEFEQVRVGRVSTNTNLLFKFWLYNKNMLKHDSCLCSA